MSETTSAPPPEPATTVKAITETTAITDKVWTPQTLIGVLLLIIGAMAMLGIFLKGSADSMNTIAGTVTGTTIGGVAGFYFGASKSK